MATTAKEKAKRGSGAKASRMEELAKLAANTKAYEDEIRAQTGSSNSFITLVQGNSGVLKPEDKAYIKGAKLYDFVVSKIKLRLGQSLDATVLGTFSLYTETEKKQRQSDMAKTVSFWMPDDALKIPLAPGSNFDRMLPNGNLLQQTHWVFLYLHKHPEIDDALISLRSYGNRVHRELQKEIKAQSEICAELRFTVTKQAIQSKAYDTTSYYPKFEVSARNFKFENGKVAQLKDGLPEEEIEEILRRSSELHESYSKMQMVSKKNVGAIAGPEPRPALAPPAYDEEEDEGGVTF